MTDAISGDLPLVAGRYRLSRVVGSGGMGTVWEAINTWTDRRVAIKFMGAAARPDGRATPPTDHVERFFREAKITARVRHPHVVDVLDMGNDPAHGGLFIVYDFLEGESLRALLERSGALSPEEALTLLAPAMEGVAEAHRRGVVHRDLKPENIFLARESGGRTVPRVIDFGIAKASHDEPDPSLTRTGVALGTARYMSPEQCRGAADIDARTDVWALGVIWYEALTGRVPHDGGGYNQVIAAVLTADVAPLRSLRPDAPEGLASAVDRALRRDREARHPSVELFLDAIRQRPEAPRVESAPPTPVSVAPSIAPRESPPPRQVRRVIAGVALALLGVAVALRVTSRNEPSTARSAPVTLIREAPTPTTPAESALRSPEAHPRPGDPDAALHPSSQIANAVTHARSPLRRVPVTVARRPPPASLAPVVTPPPPERRPNGAPVLEP